MRRLLVLCAAAVSTAGALLVTGVGTAAADDPDVPGVSLKVDLVTQLPVETALISGVFAHTGSYFYTSRVNGLSVFDTTNPRLPLLTGTIAQAEFENESMTYAEKTVAGRLRRFVFVGNDAVQATGTGTAGQVPPIGSAPAAAREVVVFDVTVASAPVEYVRMRTTTSTHTLTCTSIDCATAYTAGSSGKFSVLDFSRLGEASTDALTPALRKPLFTELKTVATPSAKGDFASGHFWNFDTEATAGGERIGWHTGGGGLTAFDVTDASNPVLLATTNPDGSSKVDAAQKGTYNDFILHNSRRPNADRFVPSDPNPSVFKGNVAIVTEEDYEETACNSAGSIETWAIPTLDGTGAGGTPLTADAGTGTGTIYPLDRLNPINDLPNRGFCSADWFDYHEAGFIAQGFYQGGLNIIDVRDATNLSSYGFFRLPGATEVWDAYWVPVRDGGGVDTGRNTNLVYTADLIAGLGVYEVNLPAAEPNPPTPVPEVPLVAILPLGAAAVMGTSIVVRRRRARRDLVA